MSKKTWIILGIVLAIIIIIVIVIVVTNKKKKQNNIQKDTRVNIADNDIDAHEEPSVETGENVLVLDEEEKTD